MGALKIYNETTDVTEGTVDVNKLGIEIAASGYVDGYTGVTKQKGAAEFFIYGSSINSEAALDALVLAHIPTDALEKEIKQKGQRKDYGKLLHEIVSSQLRLARLAIDSSLSAHAAQRASTYVYFTTLQNNIENGNFISAYEDVNGLTVEMGLTLDQIKTYRLIVASYIVSAPGNHTDIFGNVVPGGQYDELTGKQLDADYFIIEN